MPTMLSNEVITAGFYDARNGVSGQFVVQKFGGADVHKGIRDWVEPGEGPAMSAMIRKQKSNQGSTTCRDGPFAR